MPVPDAFKVVKGGFTSLAGQIDVGARAAVAALRRQLTALQSDVTTIEGAYIPDTTVTAKGDLLVATASATVDNLAVGTNGLVLAADDSTASGLAWTSSLVVPDSVTLADDQAAYLEFGAAAHRGIITIVGNIQASGIALVWFRVGTGGGATLVVSAGTPTVTVGTGTLAGTTGTDGQLTVRADTTNNRLYIENRTGGSRSYSFTILGAVGAMSTGAWTIV